jgi:hypothetical protein
MPRVSIERNRARSFKAALETLWEATEQLIARMDFELLDVSGMDDKEIEKKSQEVGGDIELLDVFDDALEEIRTERNAYIEQNDLEMSELQLKWKETSNAE